ncbi:MAG TPA: acylphosphatase [Gemmatimonadaceae bacterium]|nr:acylphosphatase [Gemmatimonadaceae bacterium]
MQTLHVRISGKVQGVGFRWFVREEARRLGLSGWVTNLPGGEVEVRAGGERGSLERLRRALQVGPSGAQVERVDDVAGDHAGTLPYPFNIHR